MRVLAAAVLFVVIASTVRAQTAPVVNNVRASQRADASRLVDIYYDLTHNAPCTVWPVVSGDGGATWNVPALTLTGNVGHNVAPGPDRHIVWDAGRDIPGVAATMRARVFADDGGTLSNMVFVAAGSFPYQRSSSWTYVDSFFIDKYEVTNVRYAEFLNDADPDGEHWALCMEITRSAPPNVFYTVPFGRENYPARCVSALDADAFAAWLSEREGRTFRLPTQQEWEKAAAWDPTINKYWTYAFQSDSISCADANVFVNVYCIGAPTEVGRYNGVTPETNDAKSYYGAYDMTGNVFEWTATGCGPTCRIIRGGGWNNLYKTYESRSAGTASPDGTIGFRLVLDPN
jgi:formylglycine-generating enzyme required for sulfatase activity